MQLTKMMTGSGVSLMIPDGKLGASLVKQLHLVPFVSKKELEEQAPPAPAVEPKPVVIDMRDLVEVTVPGARVDGRWVKCFDKTGTERWFDQARLVDLEVKPGGVWLKLPRKDLASRKMSYLLPS